MAVAAHYVRATCILLMIPLIAEPVLLPVESDVLPLDAASLVQGRIAL